MGINGKRRSTGDGMVLRDILADGYQKVETRVRTGPVIYKRGSHRIAYNPDIDAIDFEYEIYDERY